MSIQVSQYVWQRSKQKQTALVVLLALADFADKVTGECFPGITTLAQMARTSIRNIQLTLKKLERDGEIVITERPGRSNLYLINGYRAWLLEGVKSSVEGGEVQRHDGTKSSTEGVKPSVEGVKPDSPEPLLEPLKETEERTDAKPPVVVVDEKYVMVWNAALNQLEVQLDRANFDTWLRGTVLVGVETPPPNPLPEFKEGEQKHKTVFVVGVRNQFVKDMLDGRLNRTVRNILCSAALLIDVKPDQVGFRVEIVPPKHTPPPAPPHFASLVERGEISASAVVRGLYEQYIGQVVPDEEPCIELVAELYPADEIEAAFKNMRLQHSGGRVRDPWGYVQGILRRRQELAGVRLM